MNAQPSGQTSQNGMIDRLRQRAGALAIMIGVVEFVGLGGVAGLAGYVQRMPDPQIQRYLHQPMSSLQISALRETTRSFAITCAVFGVGPGIVFTGLSRFVRRGAAPAIVAALALALTQTFVLAAMGAFSLIDALGSTDPVGATTAVLVWGTAALSIGYLAALLIQILRARTSQSPRLTGVS